MRIAQEAVRRFVHWLEACNHRKSYPHLGAAILDWLVSGGGFKIVPADYTTFLQVVICALSHPDLRTTGFTVRLDEQTEALLRRPEDSEWTVSISKDEFDFACFEYRQQPRQ